MKIKKKSIIIPAFALLIGASLAGSISGTVAWYQYSTRVNAAYVGVSGGTSGNLQIKLGDGEWGTRLTKEQIATYIASSDYGSAVQPITSGSMVKDGTLPSNFYLNPIYGQGGDYDGNWMKASKANYIVLPLQLRYVERDGTKEGNPAADAKNAEKEVFISDLLIQEDASNTTNHKEDLSEAIRFQINSYTDVAPTTITKRLISKNGGTTVVEGKLDLDGDGVLDFNYDSDKYGFGGDTKSDITYGSGVQTAFSSKKTNKSNVNYYNPDGTVGGSDAKVYSMVVDQVDDSMDIDDDSKEYDTGMSKSIGKTVAAEDKFLHVDVTIWVEGWQTFVNSESKHVAMWSEDFIKSSFNVGFEFAVDPIEE